MKQSKSSAEAIKIFEDMKPVLNELWKKLTKGDYNRATSFVFEISFVKSIDDTLKKLKIKRTIVNLEGVEEVEMSDIDPLLKKVRKHKKR